MFAFHLLLITMKEILSLLNELKKSCTLFVFSLTFAWVWCKLPVEPEVPHYKTSDFKLFPSFFLSGTVEELLSPVFHILNLLRNASDSCPFFERFILRGLKFKLK